MRLSEKIAYTIGILGFAAVVTFGGAYALIFARVDKPADPTIMRITSALDGAPIYAVSGPGFMAPDNIAPGWNETYTFTIDNTTTEEITYDLSFVNLSNTLIHKNALLYSLSSTRNGGNIDATQLPDEDTTVLSDIVIAGRTSQVYTLTLSYIDIGSNQINDLGAEFSFRILLEP